MPNERDFEDSERAPGGVEIRPEELFRQNTGETREAIEDQALARKVDRLLGIEDTLIGDLTVPDMIRALSDDSPLPPLKGNFHSPRGH